LPFYLPLQGCNLGIKINDNGLADRLNHRMGDIGNYIKQVQNKLEQTTGLASSKVLALENTIKDAELKVVSIQNGVNITLENPQLDQHLKLLNEKTQEAIVTIKHQRKPPTFLPPRTVPLTPWSQCMSYATTPTTSLTQTDHHTTTTSNHTTNHTHDRWGKRINATTPQTEHTRHTRSQQQHNPYFIPRNHYDFIKKAQIKYAGKMFTFYASLKNIGKVYGIYLHSLDDIRYDMSLCPTSIDGHTITDQEYADMDAALYKKLSHTEVIPTSYQCYCHIIDKYVDDNDGFQVL
jgi:hypothetical protein